MKLTLNRRPSVGGATIGELLADGARLRPMPAGGDFPYRRALDAKHRANLSVGHDIKREESFDPIDLANGQLGIWVVLALDLAQAHPNGMLQIIRVANNFQVLDSVVRFQTVFVVHGHIVGDGANECHGHETVDGMHAPNTIYAEIHVDVPRRHRCKAHQFAARHAARRHALVAHRPVRRSHLSARRNIVDARIARNAFPCDHADLQKINFSEA